MSDIEKFWYLFKLRRQAWLKTTQLLEIQEKRIKMLIRHAYDNVEYYHNKFDSVGLKPDDIRKVEDLRKIPTTTKEDVQKNFPLKITARNIDLNQCTKYTTSGSTGLPLEIMVDKRGNNYRAGVFGRPFFECGLHLRDKMMLVGDVRRFPKELAWFQKLGFLKRRYFSAAEPAERHLSEILKYQPNAIYAYSSYLFLLAAAFRKLEIKEYYPRLIFSTAEVLNKEQREFIESNLNAEVFDLYGCVETERLAWECEEHSGYHMDIDSDVIEFVKHDDAVSPGEEGKIIVTCLFNYAMPFIRYELGDIGVPLKEKCNCGRGLPLMGKILGRQDDLIVCPDGRIVISPIFMNIMRSIPGIAQYRIVQYDVGKLVVSIVKSDKFSDGTLEKVVDEIRSVVGKDVSIDASVVEEIPKESSGKIRAVVSHVKLEKPNLSGS